MEAWDQKFDFPEVEIGKEKKIKDHSIEELLSAEEELGKAPPTQENKRPHLHSSPTGNIDADARGGLIDP